MATNLAINEQLLGTAYKIGGYRTKKETVNTAHNNNFSIFTLDNDFENYKKYADIDLIDIPFIRRNKNAKLCIFKLFRKIL